MSVSRYCCARRLTTRIVTTRVSSTGPSATAHLTVMPSSGSSKWFSESSVQASADGDLVRRVEVQLHQLVHLLLCQAHRPCGFTRADLHLRAHAEQARDGEHAGGENQRADQHLDEREALAPACTWLTALLPRPRSACAIRPGRSSTRRSSDSGRCVTVRDDDRSRHT